MDTIKPNTRRLIIATNNTAIGASIAAHLESHGVGQVEIRPSGGGHYGLDIREGSTGTWVQQLTEGLLPLRPAQLPTHDPEAHDPLLEDNAQVDAVLQLPDWPAGDPLCALEISANSEKQLNQAKARLSLLPHQKLESNARHAAEAIIKPPRNFPKQWLETATFLLAREGIELKTFLPDPEEEDFPKSRNTLRVVLADPAVLALPDVPRYPVIVRTDDAAFTDALVAELNAKGFRASHGRPLLASEVSNTSITLAPGPLAHGEMGHALGILRDLVCNSCHKNGIDMERYPLQTDGSLGRFDAVVLVPAKACLDHTARATGGDHPDRFNIQVKSDNPGHPLVREFIGKLHRAGFRATEADLVTSIVDCKPGRFRRGRILHDFRVVYGALAYTPSCLEKVLEILGQTRMALDPGCKTPLSTDCAWSPEDVDVLFHLPIQGVGDGRLAERLRQVDLYPVKIISSDLSAWSELATDLETAGFTIADRDSTPTEGPTITFGAAPDEVVAILTRLVRSASGKAPKVRREFNEDDHDIYIHLPEKPVKKKVAQRRKLSDGIAATHLLARKNEPFLQVNGNGLTIAGIRLNRRSPGAHDTMVPHPNQFHHFCVDQSAAPTLRHLALSVRLGEPCLLEGETSTAKTSSILYLASILGQPVARVNLNGQTDTGELIGRFVPATESKTVNGALWSWQDGVLLEALRHGWWVILDELNLAEPAILERLNSLLERSPSLLVTEHDNRVFGPGGEPIHPEFRIFGTMNPAEYAGRNPLSPAYRDRWRGHLIVRGAGESEYRAMLRQMIFGERPRTCVDGVLYAEPEPVTPTHGELASQAGVGEFVDSLARFQASLDAACQRGKDGDPALSGRKERPVFTRRGLIALLDHLASPAHAGRGMDHDQLRQEGIHRYFLARFSCEEETTVVRQLLQASGLVFAGSAA